MNIDIKEDYVMFAVFYILPTVIKASHCHGRQKRIVFRDWPFPINIVNKNYKACYYCTFI